LFLYFFGFYRAIFVYFLVRKIILQNMANENIDEKLFLNQQEQVQAASRSREQRGQERLAMAEGDRPPGDTITQDQDMARNAKAPSVPVPEAGEMPSSMSAATGKLLEISWPNLLDPFAFVLALVYINTHVMGHSVFGEKVFCALGEEWIPTTMRTGIYAQSFKDKARTFGLLEIIGLTLLDTVSLIALLVLVVGIMYIISNVLHILQIVGLVSDTILYGAQTGQIH